MASKPLRLAFVLPRYGAQLGGGAETLCREILLALLDPSKNTEILPIEEIQVWTTCAKDHRTWENFHNPGTTREDGILVSRFAVDPRNTDIFIRAELAIHAGTPLAVNEQLEWLKNGVNSRSLYEHIVREGEKFDAILFAPYLFPTTFWGGLIYPERSVILPCLHNEGYAYLEVFRVLLQKCGAVIFNAEPEAELAARIHGRHLFETKGSVVGMGFDEVLLAEKPQTEAPYVLYSGRKEEGKNLGLLIEWFVKAREQLPSLELRIIGSGVIEFLKELPEGVKDLGFVSEEEKHRLMHSALALCQPSVNESFSIVLMEAWLQNTPVIVHRDCEVTRFHAVSSGGGLYCGNAAEFGSIIELLITDSSARQKLAASGRAYVREVYSWSSVLKRFALALNALDHGKQERPGATAN